MANISKIKWLQVDCNPSTGRADIGAFKVENSYPIDFEKTLIIQGLITLTDTKVEDDGFHCIPGGHLFSKKIVDR